MNPWDDAAAWVGATAGVVAQNCSLVAGGGGVVGLLGGYFAWRTRREVRLLHHAWTVEAFESTGRFTLRNGYPSTARRLRLDLPAAWTAPQFDGDPQRIVAGGSVFVAVSISVQGTQESNRVTVRWQQGVLRVRREETINWPTPLLSTQPARIASPANSSVPIRR